MAAGRAASRRTSTYRRSAADTRSMYVYGNTVAKPDHEPRRQEEPYREPRRRRSSRRSRQVRQNQRRELRVGKRYVIFLSVAAVMALFICVNYVRLQSEITSRSPCPISHNTIKSSGDKICGIPFSIFFFLLLLPPGRPPGAPAAAAFGRKLPPGLKARGARMD